MADYLILNTEFDHVAFLDNFESFIWTDRYNSPGDFEFLTSITDPIVPFCIPGYYIYRKDSEHMMIIETLEINSDIESGNTFKVSGRSLESILDRRIVWDQTDLAGSFQDCIKRLINESIISPAIAERKIDNFDFIDSTDEYILSLTLEEQHTGTTLLNLIQEICEAFDVGFKITLSDDRRFKFQLYYGANRSYNQDDNPYVIFSEDFNNIINSNYLESVETVKNVALVCGEDNGANRRRLTVGAGSGLDRRELYVDARDIQSEVGGNQLPEAQYTEKLQQRGEEKLKEYSIIKTLEGQMETRKAFQYDKDFFMGDIVSVANVYGMNDVARVVEFIWSISDNGIEMYPTFKTL